MVITISYMPGLFPEPGRWCTSMTNDEFWCIGSGATPWEAIADVLNELDRLWLTAKPGPRGAPRVAVDAGASR